MKYLNYSATLLVIMAFPLQADVNKCKQASGKIIYQVAPCPSGTALENVVKVKTLTPEQAEEARIKLQAWQEQQAIEEAAKKQAEKERQDELARQQLLDLQRRSVNAQEQQVILQQQQGQNQAGGGGVYYPNRRWDYDNNRPNYYPNQYPRPPHHTPNDVPQQPPAGLPFKQNPQPGSSQRAPGESNFGMR